MSAENAPRSGVRPSAPPVPHVGGRWHKLWVIPRSGEYAATALGENVTWLWRHWVRVRGRFEICREGFGERCLLCANRIGREQSGYLPVLEGTEQVTLAVTSGAWLHSQTLRGNDGALRGRKIKAMRLRPTVNGPLRIWLPGDSVDVRRLPPAWDILAELDVRYGLADRDAIPHVGAPDRDII